MKTKEKILKMSKKELEDYKWSNDLNSKEDDTCSDCPNCSYCSSCFHCYNCFGCSHCSDCYMCRNAFGLQYAICNVVVGKENYEKKMKELGVKLTK